MFSGFSRLAFRSSSLYEAERRMTWLENYATTNILLISMAAVAGLGFASIKVRGVGPGVTGVLFAGLLFGHFASTLKIIPEFLRELG